MLAKPNSVLLPPQRPSPAGMAASGLLHIALLWLLLQYAPVQQAVRYVVVQALRPAPAPARAAPAAPPVSRAITVPAAPGTPADPLSVFTLRPESNLPMRTTDTLPELQPRKPTPRRQRRETPRPEVAPPAAPPLRNETRPTPPEPQPAPPPEEPVTAAPEPPLPAPAAALP